MSIRDWFRRGKLPVLVVDLEDIHPVNIHHDAIHELYEIVEKQAERLESLERSREHQAKQIERIHYIVRLIVDTLHNQGLEIWKEQAEIIDLTEEINKILNPPPVLFASGGSIIVNASNAQGDSLMQLSLSWQFDGVAAPVDALHQIGTPTYAWATTGSGTFDDATSATPVITPADPANADDVVSCVASNVAAAGGATQTITFAGVDLADGPTVKFPSGGTIVVAP